MILNKDAAAKLADYLLQIKAIKLQPSKPFVWSSGILSPIYCDNRLTLSYVKVRTFIRQELSKLILENFEKPDLIAGVATGGIAHGVLIAQELGLPFVYVRPAPKAHGLENTVEGHVEPGQTVIVVEDLISTGQSSLKAVASLRNAGCMVKGLVSIFDYGFDSALQSFKEQKCSYYSLSNYDVVIDQAVKNNYLTRDDSEHLKTWRVDPEGWGKKLKTS